MNRLPDSFGTVRMCISPEKRETLFCVGRERRSYYPDVGNQGRPVENEKARSAGTVMGRDPRFGPLFY